MRLRIQSIIFFISRHGPVSFPYFQRHELPDRKKCDHDECKIIVADAQPHWIESKLLSLSKDNRQFQKQILELIPKIQPITKNDTNVNKIGYYIY